MTREKYLFLRDFQTRFIQPIIENLDADQKRKHPYVNTPMSKEIASIIRSLKVSSTPHSSFHVEYTCKGVHLEADWKFSLNTEYVVWTLYNTLELAELKHVHIPHPSDYVRLRQGVHCLLQIIRPELYGVFKSPFWPST